MRRPVPEFETGLRNLVELRTMAGDATDADLVRAAREGDAAALGVLLQRHRPGMEAVALHVAGWGPQTEDIVQDAMLLACARLGQLRDPSACGAWLHAVTRNQARRWARSPQRRESPSDDAGWSAPSTLPSPTDVLDLAADRDWVWDGLGRLSEPLQVVVLLRYFWGPELTGYQQVADMCGLPVGTVRSRLHAAREELLSLLTDSATGAHDGVAARGEVRRRVATELLAAAPAGGFDRALAATAVADLVLVGPQGQRAVGQGLLRHIMESDLAAGVRQQVSGAVASTRIAILHCDLLSPPEDPTHCPPGVTWVLRYDDDARITHIRLSHPRPARARLG
jgi:RNA polymerase sigma-70 factor (ECF subfamily)